MRSSRVTLHLLRNGETWKRLGKDNDRSQDEDRFPNTLPRPKVFQQSRQPRLKGRKQQSRDHWGTLGTDTHSLEMVEDPKPKEFREL